MKTSDRFSGPRGMHPRREVATAGIRPTVHVRIAAGFLFGLVFGLAFGLGAADAAAAPADAGIPTEMLRLRATADVRLSDANTRERNSSSGKSPQLKLKNIQEPALVRFDAREVLGREVISATLFLRRDGRDRLRYIRVSTVSQDWVEGEGREPYGPPDGATFLMADASPGARRPWAWPGSSLADVIMTSGNSLDCVAERKELDDGWISVALSPAMIYAMAIGDSDGLAVMDGGNPLNENNMVWSVQSQGNEPYIEVALGRPLEAAPAMPVVKAEPAPDHSHLRSGAIRVAIEPDPNVFFRRVLLDGHTVPRWRVRHPAAQGPTVFYLEDLPPNTTYELTVLGISPGGKASPPAVQKVRSSRALPRDASFGVISPLTPKPAAPPSNGPLGVRPIPGLVKIHPVSGRVMCDDLGNAPSEFPAETATNAVWDGSRITLFGARAEYVSFQLCIENRGEGQLENVQVRMQPLVGPGGALDASCSELHLNWYARNRVNDWQPAYCVPLKPNASFSIPQAGNRIPDQRNQTVYVDVFIPKDAKPGTYGGAVVVGAERELAVEVPITLEVLDAALPERLSFWPELNAYRIPDDWLEYYRLARQHRCVLNCWAWRPKLTGRGKSIRVEWDAYDKTAGRLLSGEAFAGSRRGAVPIECMYLPFEDSWPTPLSKETYRYEGYWPGRGDDPARIVDHYLTAPKIADGLSNDYQAAFLSVQRQFIEHFREKGYSQTEMQCFFGGKVSHRIEYGANTWWTTDEPYFWDDWAALRFFLGLWSQGRGDADPRNWAARADISRPQWQGTLLNGRVDAVYYGAGGFDTAAMVRRCRTIAGETGQNLRVYGSASHDSLSNTETVTILLGAWCDGADAYLPWQTLGNENSLERNDAGAQGGNAILVPGRPFGEPVLADLRLKAFRDGQQLIEYLNLLSERKQLTREQLKAMIHEATRSASRPNKAAQPIDDADGIEFSTLSAWQISELRRRVAEMLIRRQGTP